MSIELKKWLIATRPWSIPASAVPVIAAGVWLYAATHKLPWELALIVLLSTVLFQLAGNLISDYFDFTRGVDTVETAGSRTLPDGIFRPRTILLYGCFVLAIASGLGFFLAIKSGPFLFYLGLFGVIATAFYYVLKYSGFGVFLIFTVFGPCIALGTEYALTSCLSWPVFLISLPIGLLTTAILHANDIRDMPHDRAAGIQTFALWLGRQNAERFYRFLIVSPYALVGIYCFTGMLPCMALLTLTTIPLANSVIRNLTDLEKIDSLDQQTALLQTAFSIMLIASFAQKFFESAGV
ncbi:MAG: prenyltransferase [Planctomycetia bacterium]|nr:prenyltransferase [Planctomycetia bacterium]